MEIIKETAAEQDADNQRNTAFQGNTGAAAKVASGAAIKRMQEIAQNIYDSTPGMNEEMPRQTSKILQNVKNTKKGAGGLG